MITYHPFRVSSPNLPSFVAFILIKPDNFKFSVIVALLESMVVDANNTPFGFNCLNRCAYKLFPVAWHIIRSKFALGRDAADEKKKKKPNKQTFHNYCLTNTNIKRLIDNYLRLQSIDLRSQIEL